MEEQNSSSEFTKYEVAHNDTVVSIAVKFGMTAANFKRINRLSTTALLYPGQVVLVKHCLPTRNSAPASPSKSPSLPNKDTTDPILVTLRQNFDRHYVKEPEQLASLSVTSSAPTLFHNKRPSGSQNRVGGTAVSPSIEQVEHSAFYKDTLKYVVEETSVLGNITITPEHFIFEPNMDEKAVELYGLMKCQFTCFPSDIIDARILNLSYLERISLGFGNIILDHNERQFLQLTLKSKKKNLENEHPVGYFIINDENAKKFEDNIKQFLKPDVFQENANAIKNPGLRYGRLIAEKLFPNYSVEKVEEEKWDRIPELKGKSYILKDDDVAAFDSFNPSI